MEVEIEQANKEFKTYPNQDIRQQQQQVEQIEAEIKSSILNQGINQQQKSDRAQQLRKLFKQTTQHKLTENKQQIAQKRIDAAQE